MKTATLLTICCLLVTVGLYAQTLPTAPNQRNTEGKRVGSWVITYTKSWKETNLPDSIAFYRKLTFDATGKPQGKTTDYYRNGKKQWEGVMLQIEPTEIQDGLVMWFNEKGDTTKAYFEGGEEVDINKLRQKAVKLFLLDSIDAVIPLMTKIRKIHLSALNKKDIEYAVILEDLGFLFEQKKQHYEAEQLFEEALKIKKNELGGQNAEYLMSLENLANFYVSQNIFNKANRLLNELLLEIERGNGINHVRYIDALYLIANLNYKIGDYNKAELLYLKGLEILKKNNMKFTRKYIDFLNNLSSVYFNQGKLENAEILAIEAFELIKRENGEENTDFILSLNNLASIYREQGQYFKADTLFFKCYTLSKRVNALSNQTYIAIVNNLASSFFYWGKYKEAITMLEKELKIFEISLKKRDLNYATLLNNLAVNYEKLNQYDKSELLYIDILKIYKDILGAKHPNFAKTLNNLAFAYDMQDKFVIAETKYLEALNIFNKEHPDFALTLSNLAVLYFRQGQYKKADSLYSEAYKINKAFLLEFFNTASDQQQEAYWNKNKASFEYGYSWASKHPSMQSWTYNNALFVKGLRLASAANLQAYLNSSIDTAVASRYQLYLSVKRTLGVQYSKPIQQRYGVAALEAQAEQLEKELMRRSAIFRDFKKSFEITHTEVQQALKPNEAAIEFIDYTYYNGIERTDTTYYAALVLRPGWAMPKMVRLCEKKQLEVAISGNNIQSRETNTQILYSYNRGLPVADSKSQVYKSNLYELLWHPIDSLLVGVSTIHYAPSGLLHRLNLAAIAKSADQRLGDVYDLRRLSSTRQLAQNSTFNPTTQRSLLVGNVSYDADSTQLTSANQPYQASKRELYASRSERQGSAWASLTNTGPEIKAIAALSSQADTLTGYRATEEAFYHYLGKHPRIVHLATHGFFYEPPQDTLRRKKDEPVFVNATEALLRSGLVLAGANWVWQGKAPLPKQEDGILTAYEISLKDLRQTELVVMSACETGLGDIKGSEGVFGLQRAFKIAGAKNIIMSLWQIPDKATRQMMEMFYTHYLKEKKSIRDSFKLAVNYIKQQYEEPYFFAGFVLVE